MDYKEYFRKPEEFSTQRDTTVEGKANSCAVIARRFGKPITLGVVLAGLATFLIIHFKAVITAFILHSNLAVILSSLAVFMPHIVLAVIGAFILAGIILAGAGIVSVGVCLFFIIKKEIVNCIKKGNDIITTVPKHFSPNAARKDQLDN